MSDPNPAPDKKVPRGRSRFAGLHARTYEMELLLSGAVVLGLLQLPSTVGAAFERFQAGLMGSLRLVGILAEGYVQLALYVLIGSFVLHLVLRAYWIGLLGLESVFEGGIRWDKVKLGPLAKRVYRDRLGSLARAVDRADDLCSLIFSFGFLIVISFAYTIIVFGIAGLAAFAASRLSGGDELATPVFWVMAGALLLFPGVANSLDKKLTPKAAPGGVLARLLGGLVSAGYAVSPMRWTGPIQFTLGSNISEARLGAAIIGVCVLLGGMRAAGLLADRGVLRLDSRAYFPVTLNEEGIDSRHYRDRRDPGAIDPALPSVQSLVATGPYVGLVIPYSPRRHNALMEARCPGLVPLRGEGLVLGTAEKGTQESIKAAASCLGSLFVVSMDGQTLETLHWDFIIDEGSRLPAVVSFLPARELDSGRHELEVLTPGRDATADDPDAVRHLIPFWH